MRLGLALGKTAGELDALLTPREWSEWQQFMAEEWIGPERVDLGFAGIIAMLYNIHRTQHAPSRSPLDFMPFREREEERESTPAEFAASLGAEVIG